MFDNHRLFMNQFSAITFEVTAYFLIHRRHEQFNAVGPLTSIRVVRTVTLELDNDVNYVHFVYDCMTSSTTQLIMASRGLMRLCIMTITVDDSGNGRFDNVADDDATNGDSTNNVEVPRTPKRNCNYCPSIAATTMTRPQRNGNGNGNGLPHTENLIHFPSWLTTNWTAKSAVTPCRAQILPG